MESRDEMTHFLYSPGNKEYSFPNAPRSISPEKVDIDSKAFKAVPSIHISTYWQVADYNVTVSVAESIERRASELAEGTAQRFLYIKSVLCRKELDVKT